MGPRSDGRGYLHLDLRNTLCHTHQNDAPGDEKAMARDVERVLSDVLGEAGIDELRKAGRYQRDVY